MELECAPDGPAPFKPPVSESHPVFVELPFHSADSPSGSASSAAVEDRESETPPPILDCYAPEPGDPLMVVEEYMRVHENEDDEPMTLASEAEPVDPILQTDVIEVVEASTSNGHKKPVILKPRGEKKNVKFVEHTQVRRSTRQIKRKCKAGESPEGSPGKAGRNKTSPKGSTKAQIYETGPINGVIRIGDDYQVDVPEWTEDAEDNILSEDRDIRESCLWKNYEEMNSQDLEDFCRAARRQFRMNPGHALYALQFYNFDIMSAMEHIESHIPEFKRPFTPEEQKLFFKGLATYGKDFCLIHHEFVGKRNVRELIEFYYDSKNTKCFGDARKCCPSLLRLDSSEEPIIPRTQCDNCLGNLKNNVKMEIIRLCEICDLYYRKSGKMRPFTVPLDGFAEDEENEFPGATNVFVQRKTSDSCEPTSSTSELVARHDCSFTAPRLKRLRAEKRWTPEEVETAVQAFFHFGKDFQAVAGVVRTKTLSAVKRFYTEKQSTYRLDYLINRPVNPDGKLPFKSAINGMGIELCAGAGTKTANPCSRTDVTWK